MIVTVVPNPALDKTMVLPDFTIGKIHRAKEVMTLAGGKGFNFARALRTLGVQTTVVGPIGGHAGQQLLALAAQEGLIVDAQKVEAELRTCLTIVDPAADYRLTEIYEQGVAVTPDEWYALVHRVGLLLSKAQFLVINGSFPPGTPEDGLVALLQQAKMHSVPVLLDTHGAQLPAALALEPALLKINQFEAAEATGLRIDTPGAALEAAAALQRLGAQAVVITLGKAGVVGRSHAKQSFGWSCPSVPAICSTGSGDSLLAGIVADLVRGQPLAQAARLGAAAGVANTLQLGAGRFTQQQIAKILPQIRSISE
ncbi:1-phosphofructokinase family hexose kinase [Dictyobacter kobayashii]|uniref:1-phosphofructokinase n=1 Tax=Dictyobacter kobayashii TaxID=2014872 RepID=A0A402AX23_9CHLR|nr:hexose kinase [Dictyobacter kobayashii]GCE23637.1 1-phosphofructokinase [Dictyobacter kobayashii]